MQLETADTTLIYKIVAAVGALWGLISSIAYVPLRGRVKTLEGKVDNTMSRDQTVEAIELRQQPLADEIHRLNYNTEHLSKCITQLTSTLSDLQQWQNRMIGAGYTNGNTRGGDR